MYKNLLSALLVMGSASAAFAQVPVLTASNTNPVVGNKFIIHETSSTLSAGPSGANQTWDFTSVVTTAIDTGLIKACTDVTPSCTTFLPGTGANMVQTVPAPLKIKDYMQVGVGDSIAHWGYYQSADTFLKLTDPMKTMVYGSTGFTYLSNFTDSFRGSYQFGMLPSPLSGPLVFQEKGEITVNADAWGLLKLPGRTDTTLRVHMHEVHHDSAHIALPFPLTPIDSVVTLDIDQYVWYKPGYHAPLLLIVTATMSGSSSPLYRLLAYAPKDVTGVNDVAAQTTSIELFPNPSNGVVNIKWSEMELGNAEVAVSDITGRVVYKANMNISSKAGQAQIALPEATSGIYFVSVKSGNVNYNGKISIAK